MVKAKQETTIPITIPSNVKLMDSFLTGILIQDVRKNVVKQLKIKMEGCCNNTIQGYTGCTTSTGKVIVNLMVDLAQDEVQEVHILIGQSFINKN